MAPKDLSLAAMQFGVETSAFKDMLTVDGYAVFLYLLLLISGLLSVALSYDYGRRMGWIRGEYYVLMLFSIAGAMLIASANNLIVVFLAVAALQGADQHMDRLGHVAQKGLGEQADTVCGHVGVNLGGCKAGVSQQFLDIIQLRTVIQQMSRECMP